MIRTRHSLATGFILATACTPDPGGINIHNADPSAEITYPTDGASLVAGQRTVTGTVEDPDHAAEELTLSWLYDGAEACPPVSPDASGNTSCEIFLQSGERTITLQVEDPLGGLASDGITLDVQPYGDPWAEISAPVLGGIFYSDQLVELEGTVGDEADDPQDLEAWWESSLDGELGVEVQPDASGNVVDSEYLSEGEHQLLLYVRNTGGNEAYDSVTINVGPPNSAPSCSIASPDDGAAFEYGEVITFGGTAQDVDVPPELLSASWASLQSGELAQQTPLSDGSVTLSVNDLPADVHNITLTVLDDQGATCSAGIVVTVTDCSAAWYADLDGDSYGDPGSSATGCEAPSGYVADDQDCDDGDAAVHPGATERCDGGDNDCDGSVDEADAVDASTWYADTDGDGYGTSTTSALACSAPSGFVADSSDCDDLNAAINPGASELCDAMDNDCDGSVDEADAIDASSWYADTDSDGYGDPLVTTRACTVVSGYVSDDSDCDDSAASVNPGADEYCNGWDDDCDTTVDESDAIDAPTWYEDRDGDGQGDDLSSAVACSQPSGFEAVGGDCDDADAAVNTAATELCDSIDNDCDGSVDEDDAADAATWYADLDADGYGDAGSAQTSCAAPSDHVSDASDCDDSDAAVHPGAAEYCDGIDSDCDGTLDEDEALDAGTWYLDADSDGYGDASAARAACSQPSGYLADASDCDDSDAGVNPGMAEACDGVDTDCSGAPDASETDADGDGWMLCDGDCDDSDAAKTPADDDGDGFSTCGSPADCDDSDASLNRSDFDSDGWDSCAGDCNDYDASVELDDLDGDGVTTCDDDCDDSDDTVYPGAPEHCDSVLDNDCDGLTDDNEFDDDGDGYTECDDDCDDTDASLTPDDGDLDGYSGCDGDCDDGDSTTYPGALELLDGSDHNCDGYDDEWIPIAGGTFDMGDGTYAATPITTVTVDSFEMWRSEVTVRQYEQCYDAGACGVPCSQSWNNNWLSKSHRQEHPINYVSWVNANQFCAWVGGRLPTEAEWEYAVTSGGAAPDYPWGSSYPTCTEAVMSGCDSHTDEVCGHPAGDTAEGLCDMIGNVGELVYDGWHDDYSSLPTDGSAWGSPSASTYAISRGGGFFTGHDRYSSTMRCQFGGWCNSTYCDSGGNHEGTSMEAGFRCAR